MNRYNVDWFNAAGDWVWGGIFNADGIQSASVQAWDWLVKYHPAHYGTVTRMVIEVMPI